MDKKLEITPFSCFKEYDVRGEIGININSNIVYRIGRATAYHFDAQNVVVGYDSRESSIEFAQSVARGICDNGSNALMIDLAGTEEMYWAVTEFQACAGIIVTASHNPINYNGLKIVKSGSRPLDSNSDFKPIKQCSEKMNWHIPTANGKTINIAKEARQKYVKKVLSFICHKQLRPLKIGINCGNGAAGPTIDEIIKGLEKQKTPLKFYKINHKPDPSFPNGIPNPMLTENQKVTSDFVIKNELDLAVAFDGDFDRCFLFNEKGKFVSGEYLVGLLASIFLRRRKGQKIVHDPRVIWNTISIVDEYEGICCQSKTGHAFVKNSMRVNDAVYGGEISCHHYFRDFAYCDSGMIPWLLIVELISIFGLSLSQLVEERIKKFPSSGEINFSVPDVDKAISSIFKKYKNEASIDRTDGISFTFEDWRFNVRKSNTEPFIRLNVEARGTKINVQEKVVEISNLIEELI